MTVKSVFRGLSGAITGLRIFFQAFSFSAWLHGFVDGVEALAKRLASRATGRETLRAVGLGALALLALIPMWSATQVVFYAIGVMALVLLAQHWIRKLLFPYVDLQVPFNEACKTPIGAAIVYTSTLAFIGFIGFGIVWLVK